MNLASTAHTRIQLRSGKILSENTRGRPRVRRRPIVRRIPIVCESAPPTLERHQTPLEEPIPQATMGEPNPPPDPLNNNNPPPVRRMREYTLPHVVDHPSCIILPPCNTHYEIKSSTLSIMPTFHALKDESPYDHLMEFEQACTTVKLHGLPEDGLKLRLFPFTLKDGARKWLLKLPPRSIHSWFELQEAFLSKFFPPSKAAKVRDSIVNFKHQSGDAFYETWERFKDLVMSCPHHGLEQWFLVDVFYRGLSSGQRQRVDTFRGCTIAGMSPDEAWDTFEDLATNSELWDDFGSRRLPPTQPAPQVTRVHNVSSESLGDDMMRTQFDRLEAALNKKIDMLMQSQSKPPPRQVNSVISSPPCFYCGSLGHQAEECAYMVEEEKEERQQVNQVSSYPQGSYQSPSKPYNNFAPRNEQGSTQGYQPKPFGNNAQRYQERSQGYNTYQGGDKYQGSGTYGGHRSSTFGAPPGFSTQGGNTYHQGVSSSFAAPRSSQAQESAEPSMKDMIATLVQGQVKNNEAISALEQGQNILQQGLSKIELQMGQMAKEISERPRGTLPSNVEQNPKFKTKEQCNAIFTSHSGISHATYTPTPLISNVFTPSPFIPIHENFDHMHYMEDGAKEEENVLLGNYELSEEETCAKNEGVVLGKRLGYLSFENDITSYGGVKTQEGALSEETPRHENVMVSNLGGEAMMAMDPPRTMSTSRELLDDDVHVHQAMKITPDERRNKKKTLTNELHEVFKKVEINIPLLELICKVPVYANFLKDLCTKKKRLEEHEVYKIEGHVSSMIQHNMPPKRKDPGSFTIGCQIGETHLDGALMDLGASVNVMPLSLYKRLSIGALQPTPIALTFADGSKRRPAGVVEDVLVRVDKFILPADFVVLDMGDDPNEDNGFPLIFGRPFMATAGVKINVLKGTISFKVLGEKVKFEMFKPIHPPEVVEEVFSINLVKGNSAKSERIFGPLNPPKPTPRAQDYYSKPPPLSH